jgi:L-histidine Nalpha-methyltransferase
MPLPIKILHSGNKELYPVHGAFGQDVRQGLSRTPKSLPCKYFYDEEGSRLFQQITDLPEYYLTRCEFEILRNHGSELAALLAGGRFNLVELGAGDGRKTRVLLKQFLDDGLDFCYIPIDLCETAVRGLIGELKECWAQLGCEGLVAEYFDGLRRLSTLDEHRTLVLFLGSNIGNFNQAEMRVFLHNVRESLNEGDLLLIGFDLTKDIPLIEKAYNDAQGITAQFNLNLLHRINRELGGNFRADRFRYFSHFDPISEAIESYLVSNRKQVVAVERLNRSFFFEAGESIHTERSQKFLESDVVRLAEETGFTVLRQWKDHRGYFLDSLWQAGHPGPKIKKIIRS